MVECESKSKHQTHKYWKGIGLRVQNLLINIIPLLNIINTYMFCGYVISRESALWEKMGFSYYIGYLN